MNPDEVTGQVGTTDEKKMDKATAVELSLMFAILAGSAAKKATGDGEESTGKYREALIGTFNEFLNSLGYEVVEKTA